MSLAAMLCREQVWPTGKVIDVRDAARLSGRRGECLAGMAAGECKTVGTEVLTRRE